MGIKSKLMVSYVLLMVFSMGILGFLVEHKSRDVVSHEMAQQSKNTAQLIENMLSVRNDLLTEKISTDLYFAEKLLYERGNLRIVDTEKFQIGGSILPSLYAGDTNLTSNPILIHEIEKSTGGITSLFILQDHRLIRVATNLTLNGKSALGTSIDDSSLVYNKIIDHLPYYGKALYGQARFITGYKPIEDQYGKVIGAIALGYSELNPHLEKTLNDINIGKSGYVTIMDSSGDVLVHPDMKGKNLGSFDFAKEILQNKNGIIQYSLDGVRKVSTYRYFEPWDWYIIVSHNYDDLKSSSNAILNTTIFAGLFIFFVGVILSLFLANTLVKPINQLKGYMEIAAQGDLSIHSDITSDDEMGVLSNSFNHMISENKRLLEEILTQDQLKTEFFANMSHELKTPLNIIFSTIQLLALYTDEHGEFVHPAKLKKHVYIIKQNCYRLVKLINNLIDITKIDSGYIKLNLRNRNVVEIIENITLSTVPYGENATRNLIFDTDIEEKIMAIDLEMIERIMLNLISNAIKFTKPKDDIEVSIHDGESHILISVKDTGMGIPEDKQQEIFQRFKQVGPLLTRRHEGSGIGLSIVKSLVEMHNGEISVKSVYGRGTEFVIKLPVIFSPDDDPTDCPNDFSQQSNVENIHIEFSDIYTQRTDL